MHCTPAANGYFAWPASAIAAVPPAERFSNKMKRAIRTLGWNLPIGRYSRPEVALGEAWGDLPEGRLSTT